MNSRLTMVGAGTLAIICAWLPWFTVIGTTHNGFMGDMQGNPSYFFIVMGAIIAGMGALNRKWTAIVAILFSVFVCLLGLKYYNDATTGDAKTIGAAAGYGVYCIIVAGLVGIAGGVMRFLVEKNTVVA